MRSAWATEGTSIAPSAVGPSAGTGWVPTPAEGIRTRTGLDAAMGRGPAADDAGAAVVGRTFAGGPDGSGPWPLPQPSATAPARRVKHGR